MCLLAGLAFAGTGLSIASQVAGYAAQNQQAKAAQRAQNQNYSQTAAIAMANYSRQVGQIQTSLSQADAADAVTGIQNALSASSARGTAAVQAAERGVSGNSVEALYGEFAAIDAANRLTLKTNRDWRERQAYEEMLALEANTKSAIASATPQAVPRPNPLALGLTIAGTAATGITGYMRDARLGPFKNSTPQE
jgi:hypothetical protein